MKLTLRPNAAGDENGNYYYLSAADQGAGQADKNWQCIDEEPPDDDLTYVKGAGNPSKDLYNLPASTGSGTINRITVYARCKRTALHSAQIIIKSDGILRGGGSISLTGSWANYSAQWATNPADGQPWEWADIDALQIGIELYIRFGEWSSCTQLYVEVDYTPEGVPPVPPTLEGWLPMPPHMGPPLPKFLQIFWPWYK